MKEVRNKKGKIQFVILTTIILCGITTISNASLQVRPNAKSKTSISADKFFSQIRQMENSGEAMGLFATIDDTGTETSGSNNIDVHMIKNTEWGGAAMLSASAYGEAPSGRSDASTTGNSYGIYQMADYPSEYVAGIVKDSNKIGNIKNVAGRYRNEYTAGDENTSIPGDAIKECKGWKLATEQSFVYEGVPIFARSYGSLFSYGSYDGYRHQSYTSRVAVVCGSGF